MTKPISQWSSKDILTYWQGLDRQSQVRLSLFFLGAVLFLLFIFWPAWILRPQVQLEIQTRRGQILNAQTQIAQEPKLIAEKKEHEAFVQKAQSTLLKQGEGEGIVGILAGISERSGVTMVSAEPQNRDDEREAKFPTPFDMKYRRFSYKVTLEGGYHELAAFVSLVENYPKILRINELSIVPQEQTPKTHIAQILISAFEMLEVKKTAILK